MNNQDQIDFSRFLGELQAESDRGLPLVAAALIDEKLCETLKGFFCEGKAADRLLVEGNAPLSSFSSRIDACYALGLIDDFEYLEIGLIRKIRNEFAHARHGLTFSDKLVESLAANFRTPMPEGLDPNANIARAHFTYAAVEMVLRLFYRGKWVAIERRQSRVWVTPEQVRWRWTDRDGPPPEGVAVVTINQGQVGLRRGEIPGQTPR